MRLEQCTTLGSGFQAGLHSGACGKKRPCFFDPREWQDVAFLLTGSPSSASLRPISPAPTGYLNLENVFY